MARISNTTAYPTIIPDANDYVILTDKDNQKITKTCTFSGIQSLFGLDTLVAHVTVTSAELLALQGTDKVLIASPGANKVIDIVSLDYFFDVGNTQYNFAADAPIKVGTALYHNIALATLNSATDSIIKPVMADNMTLTSNTTCNLSTGNTVNQGNGILYLNIFYR